MIVTNRFGRTGHPSSRVLFGGAALMHAGPAEADRALDLLLEHGINHIDTSASYGASEELLGRWIGRHRKQFFLATKTGKRDATGAREELARSLERMGVDHVDLLQLHCLIDPEEWSRALGPDGALEALVGAKEEGLTRFIGVTAHGTVAPAMLIRSLDRFDFDTVLVPYNYPLMQHRNYASDFERLAMRCHERDVPMQTIKAMARRPRAEDDDRFTTWYEPLTDPAQIGRAAAWVLGRQDVFLNSVADMDLLPRLLDAAEQYAPGSRPTDAEMDALVREASMIPVFPVPPPGGSG